MKGECMSKNYEFVSEQIIKRICQCGWNAYLCGGAVRDEFLDIDPSDFDIVTDALPEELERIFPDMNVKTFGVSFLVTTVEGIDVATYRSDKNSGSGRFNCITEACETLDQDLARRDFTFNALAVCPYTGEVVDPFDGRKDLDKRIVKFVGEPNLRIYEDPLRMIRAARFAALIEGRIDLMSFKAIHDNRHMVKNISPERVRMELLKVMKYNTPSIFFDILHETKILEILIPELDVMYGHTGGKFHGETLDQHFKITGDSLSKKDPILRLVGYFHDIGKPVSYGVIKDDSFINHEKIGADLIESIFKRFKFTTKETERVKNLVMFHMRSLNSFTTNKAARRFVKKISDVGVSFKDWIKLKIADKKANLSNENYTKETIKSIALKIHNCKKLTPSGGFKITDLNINGNDIMELYDIKPSPLIGKILKGLLELVLENPIINTQKELLSILKTDKKKWVQW